jgi:hypothetical protein
MTVRAAARAARRRGDDGDDGDRRQLPHLRFVEVTVTVRDVAPRCCHGDADAAAVVVMTCERWRW